MIESISFFVFAAILACATIFMVFSKNVIHAAYALVVILLCIAAFYVLLNAEYLAVIQIFMYAGGVVVLLVFGIMLTNREKKGPPISGHRQVMLSVILGISLLVILLQVTLQVELAWEVRNETLDQTKEIGVMFMTDHLLAFELIAVLLLMTLVAAAFLAKKSSENG